MAHSQETKKAIKEKGKQTRERRSLQRCQVFEMKIDHSHLNKTERERLKMFFVEGKRLYNYLISIDDPFKFDYKQKNIMIKNKDNELVSYALIFLPSRLRQGVWQGLKNNVFALSKRKGKGGTVGRLKFKRNCVSLDLGQYGQTHKVMGRNRVKILGIKRHLLVRGLNQITKDHEIANAKLMEKADGYYIKLTCFSFLKGEIVNEKKSDVGLDFGIKNNITTSDGEVFNCSIGETGRLKRLQRRMTKKVKGSNNRNKMRRLCAIEYQRMLNRKKDAANKLVHRLRNSYGTIFMQDENLRGWQKSWFGKQVQHSYLGLVKAQLKSSGQAKMVDRFVPTTKACYVCGSINDVKLSERIYRCDCGLAEDRDVKAAKTVLKCGMIKHQVPTGRRNLKPAEKEAATQTSVKSKSLSMKQEA
jgi:putative transposase